MSFLYLFVWSNVVALKILLRKNMCFVKTCLLQNLDFF